MDGSRFDHWTRLLSAEVNRRRTLQGVTGGILAALLGWQEIVASKPKNKKSCPKGQRRCGRDCCTSAETCQRGRCVHHCTDGIKNQGKPASTA